MRTNITSMIGFQQASCRWLFTLALLWSAVIVSVRAGEMTLMDLGGCGPDVARA